jgi:hypothetical protein
MLAETEDEKEQAILHYELWKAQTLKVSEPFEVSGEDHRQKALELYQNLYEKTPNFEYKQRIEELLGEEV